VVVQMTLFLFLALFLVCACGQGNTTAADVNATTTADVNATTTTDTTAPPTTLAPTTAAAVLPPGCMLRPEVPSVTYQRVQITVQRDFLTTDCATFLQEVAQDMRLVDTNQLWLTGCVSGSFVGSVSVSDPNSVAIVQTYLSNVASGRCGCCGLRRCILFSSFCFPGFLRLACRA
jgi:hypothetical protein